MCVCVCVCVYVCLCAQLFDAMASCRISNGITSCGRWNGKVDLMIESCLQSLKPATSTPLQGSESLSTPPVILQLPWQTAVGNSGCDVFTSGFTAVSLSKPPDELCLGLVNVACKEDYRGLELQVRP